MRLLITGTHGCGKRSLGHLLATTRSFAHVDLDSRHLGVLEAEERWAQVENALGRETGTVVTWTPEADALQLVELMQANGFEWIWLDGDRGAALHAALGDAGELAPRLVDVFEPDGTFRPLELVLREVLSAPAATRAAAGALQQT